MHPARMDSVLIISNKAWPRRFFLYAQSTVFAVSPTTKEDRRLLMVTQFFFQQSAHSDILHFSHRFHHFPLAYQSFSYNCFFWHIFIFIVYLIFSIPCSFIYSMEHATACCLLVIYPLAYTLLSISQDSVL